LRSPISVSQFFKLLVHNHFEGMIRAVLNAGETILTEMIDRVRHYTGIIRTSLVDIINAMSHTSATVQTCIIAYDLELPYFCCG